MRLPPLGQWEPVLVRWMDSSGNGEGGWQKISRKDQEIDHVVTVGQVYAQSRDRLTLCFSWDRTNKHTDAFITIPAVAITKLVRLDEDGALIGSGG